MPDDGLLQMKFKISRHAKEEMRRRAIPVDLVNKVLENPQQVVPGQGSKKVYQSKLDFGKGRIFLLRVVIAEIKDQAIVVTVYKTSKIDKYWRKS